ncbi:Mov34/MPN/PAD-1 family protein [Flavobacterium sp. ST-75]|uniref:Mov34/MPN/PAD-1 family protein n=1 Tax=Flavobacterium rhizophilum TaxID=3163296 RepID=A0ABW8YA79_9FLAO
MMEILIGSIKLKIAESVFDNIYPFIQDDNIKPEAGGILLGYYITSEEFCIIEISLPCVEDKATRYSFIRSRKNAQKIIDKNFKRSDGKIIYLGEWHTHPEDYPSPSGVDRNSIKERLKKDKLNSDVIFTLILGRKGLYIAAVNKNGIFGERNINYDKIE